MAVPSREGATGSCSPATALVGNANVLFRVVSGAWAAMRRDMSRHPGVVVASAMFISILGLFALMAVSAGLSDAGDAECFAVADGDPELGPPREWSMWSDLEVLRWRYRCTFELQDGREVVRYADR